MFFDTPGVTKIVLPEVLQNLKEGTKLYLLAQKTEPKRVFFFFAHHTMPGETKGSPFQFLRLRASEAKRRSLYCSAFTSVLVFFSRDIPSAFVLIEGYFLRGYFSATIQTFQKETQLDALPNRVKTFRKFSTGAILLGSKARNFRKFLGFLSILLFFFANHSELARLRY